MAEEKQQTSQEKQNKSSYTAKDIQVLGNIEAVRKRPGMYIGSTGLRGLHHLVYEVVDNSVDEAMAGSCSEIKIIIHKDNSVTVKDNGRGIPTEILPKYNKSALELVMTTLHAGGKFDRSSYKVSGGLHGVGISVVNALSKTLSVTVHRDGKIYLMNFDRGVARGGVEITGTTQETGTIVTFIPDTEIFDTINFDFDTIASRMRELAFLNKGLHIIIIDERETDEKTGNQKTKEFKYEGGILSFVEFLNKNKTVLHPIISFEKQKEKTIVECAIQYNDSYNETVFSFVNNINTAEGGTHLTGFKTALTRTINSYVEKMMNTRKGVEIRLSSEDVREGLTAIISLKLPEPQFEGQTKTKLGNSEIKGIVDSIVSEEFGNFFEENPKVARSIIDKAVNAAKARDAARKARELSRRKSLLEGSRLPGKLADCSDSDPSKCEIFFVEGDSAGGCFSGDTKIALADGRNISFIELIEEQKQGKEHYCYTIIDNGRIGLQQIINPRKTKINADVIKLILDNNQEISCTPDHLFMLRDGTYKQAAELKVDDSLMPLRRQISKKGKRITIEGYELVFDTKENRWIFTQLLADEYNIRNGLYTELDGTHRHHKDFNKVNNNPTNVFRLTKEEHLALHSLLAHKTLMSEEVLEKLRKLRKTPEFRENIRQKMLVMREELSRRAKAQWENEEYKKFMVEKFLNFYKSNQEYRQKSLEKLNIAQQKYWSSEDNRKKQAERVKKIFKENPELKIRLSEKAIKQWNNKELRQWRSRKTSEQWTPEFRERRKIAYDKTYYEKTIKVLRDVYDKNKEINVEEFNALRKDRRDKSILSYNTFLERFFASDETKLKEAVENFNHKIKDIIWLTERMDVYDIEVPGTHNFALASGVFVHNSAKQGRNRNIQAVLPLRGKILNVEKARLNKIIANNEIITIVSAIGTGIGDEFDIKKSRYHKIVIMCDADVDGNHITTLLLTFFFRYLRGIIEAGQLYIAQPPLYLITKGKTKKYAYNEAEKDLVVKELGEGSGLQRYKGLGEMNPDQLWETTMNPETRVLKKVMIEDAVEADQMFTLLMGDEVEPRRDFIMEHAKNVINLDI